MTPCYYPYLYIYLCLQLLHISKIHTKTKEVPSYLIFDVDQKIISQKIKEAKKYISKAKKRSQKEKKWNSGCDPTWTYVNSVMVEAFSFHGIRVETHSDISEVACV